MPSCPTAVLQPPCLSVFCSHSRSLPIVPFRPYLRHPISCCALGQSSESPCSQQGLSSSLSNAGLSHSEPSMHLYPTSPALGLQFSILASVAFNSFPIPLPTSSPILPGSATHALLLSPYFWVTSHRTPPSNLSILSTPLVRGLHNMGCDFPASRPGHRMRSALSPYSQGPDIGPGIQ